VLALTLLSGHVAPSVDDNNRYLKLTPLGDRVRLVYTVFFGEIPGASERRAVDADHDGRISDGEAHAFAVQLGAEVAAGLQVEVDGRTAPVTWTTTDAGMGTPDVAAGAFSIDLVANVCLSRFRGQHRVVLRDRFRIPHPGETEAKVEDSPGVTIDRAHVGPVDDPGHDFRFAGPGGPLEDDGLELVFTANDKAPVTADGKCVERTGGGSRVPWIAAIAGGVVAIAGVAGWLLRRRTTAA
jgi:hypothetical protein